MKELQSSVRVGLTSSQFIRDTSAAQVGSAERSVKRSVLATSVSVALCSRPPQISVYTTYIGPASLFRLARIHLCRSRAYRVSVVPSTGSNVNTGALWVIVWLAVPITVVV